MKRLTELAAKGGCACKIGPHILADVLKDIRMPTNNQVLVDIHGSDDAGIFKISDTFALVQTVDFFTPMVDDPYLYGKISACNSLSDVYAMGGKPISALNIVAFPVPLVQNGVLSKVLEGANAILAEADVVILGGHSIENEVPTYGLAVTGTINPQKIWQNSGAQVGDVLVLTKPLGTGIMNTALKGNMFTVGTDEAAKSMSTLNRKAAEVAQNFEIHACTDITGFSLLGHGSEMARGSHKSLIIHTDKLPLFSDVKEAAQMGFVPAATYGNRKAITNVEFTEELADFWSDICYDPQTSGGLLIALPKAEGDKLCAELQAKGVSKATIIGEVVEKREKDIYIK